MRPARLLTYQGVTLSVRDWAKTLGIWPETLYRRLTQRGLTLEEALTTPKQRGGLRRLLTHEGLTLPMTDWANRVGLHPDALRSRLNMGWPLDKALTQPPEDNTRLLTYHGVTMPLADWAKRVGLKPSTLRSRLDDHGWSLAEALTVPPIVSRSERVHLRYRTKPLIQAVEDAREGATGRAIWRAIMARTDITLSCWLWRSGMARGRPHFRFGGRNVNPRRILYAQHMGPINAVTAVIPTCGVDRCINPEHTTSRPRGSWNKGREQRGHRYKARIPETTILAIIKDYRAGLTQEAIAQTYHVSQTYVGGVLRGKHRVEVTGINPKWGIKFTRKAHGEANGASRFTEHDIIHIITLWNEGQSAGAIAKSLGAAQSTIGGIINGETWRQVTENLPRRVARRGNSRRTVEEVMRICGLWNEGKSLSEIARILGCSRKCIHDIVQGERWSDITKDLLTRQPGADPHPDEALVWQHWKPPAAS